NTLANLGDELCDTYTAIIHDEEPGKPNEDEGVEYIQIAEWQNELVEDDGPERRYWLEGNFSEFIELKLPFEDNRFDDRPFEADSLPITVSKITVDRVSGLADRYQTSRSVFMLACWHLLLWRLTGQADIVIGTCDEGRKYEELQKAFGPIAKYLPTHGRLDSRQRFSQLLEHFTRASEQNRKYHEYFAWEVSVDAGGETTGQRFFSINYEYEELPPKRTIDRLAFSFRRLYACVDRIKIKLSCTYKEGS